MEKCLFNSVSILCHRLVGYCENGAQNWLVCLSLCICSIQVSHIFREWLSSGEHILELTYGIFSGEFLIKRIFPLQKLCLQKLNKPRKAKIHKWKGKSTWQFLILKCCCGTLQFFVFFLITQIFLRRNRTDFYFKNKSYDSLAQLFFQKAQLFLTSRHALLNPVHSSPCSIFSEYLWNFLTNSWNRIEYWQLVKRN